MRVNTDPGGPSVNVPFTLRALSLHNAVQLDGLKTYWGELPAAFFTPRDNGLPSSDRN